MPESVGPSRISPTLAAVGLGLLSLAVAGVGFHHLGAWIRLLDVPLNALLFVLCAWIALASRGRDREGAALGLILAATGFAVSALVLALDRTHPWRI